MIKDFVNKIKLLKKLSELSKELKRLKKEEQTTFDEIIEKYVEMNIAHPFREGNGRSTRIWLDLIFKAELHKVVDWSKVDKEDYLLAMERSPIKDIEIKHILKILSNYYGGSDYDHFQLLLNRFCNWCSCRPHRWSDAQSPVHQS